MAKRPTLIDITAGFGSNTQHNTNNDEIELAFDNTLSRDGSTPNQMEADLDMNSNDILNVNQLDATMITLDGVTITTSVNAIPAGSIGTTELEDDAVTTAKIAAATAGDILYWDGSGDPALLPKGTNGQVLKLAAGLPSWAAEGGGTEPSDGDKGDITVTSSGTVWTIDAGVVDGTNIALGSDAQGDIMYYNGTAWVRLPAGTSGQVLETQGAGANPQWATSSGAGLTRGTELTPVSTTAEFTSLPAGLNRIIFVLSDLSTNGSSQMIIQLGDAGGFETTGYTSTVQRGETGADTSTSGFLIEESTSSGNNYNGVLTFTRVSGNKWFMVGDVSVGAQAASFSNGHKTLSAELDRIRITTEGGTNSFDNGTVNILYQ